MSLIQHCPIIYQLQHLMVHEKNKLILNQKCQEKLMAKGDKIEELEAIITKLFEISSKMIGLKFNIPMLQPITTNKSINKDKERMQWKEEE